MRIPSFQLLQNENTKSFFWKYAPLGLVILTTSILFGFNQFYLARLTQQLSDSFQTQHYRELQSADTYGLTTKLNALSEDSQWKCISAFKNGESFFEHRSGKYCGNNLWQRKFKIIALGLPDLYIDFTISLPTEIKFASTSALILQILLFSFLIKLSRKSEYEKHANDLKIAHMTSQVVHDLASPLHSINVAHNFLTKQKCDIPYFADHVQLLELGTKRLQGVAEGLLKKRQSSVEMLKEEPQDFCLQDLLQKLVSEYELQNKNVVFTAELPQENIALHGQQTKLQRAFANIIKNAIEAMQGKGKITIQISRGDRPVTPTELAQNDNAVEISITDTGPGMSEATLNKILQGGHTEGKADGHGIGMKVVRDTITAFGGSLSAKSEPGKGTSFLIKLPMASS